MYEIHAKYNWIFLLHMLFIHIISKSTALHQREIRACMPSLYQFVSCSHCHVLTARITLSSSSNLVPRSAFFSGPKGWKHLGQWSGIISNHQEKEVQGNSFRRKGHDRRLLGHWWSDSGGCDGHRWDNQFGRTHQNTPKTKTALPASADQQKLKEPYWFSTTMSALTQVYEPKMQSPIWLECAPPPPPIFLTSRRHIFTVLGHWKMHCVGQVLKMTKTWFLEWGHGNLNRKRAGTGKACVPLFRAGVMP